MAWIELPETYRYQRLFEKAYLVNEKGEMEREAVEILLEDGKTYYRPFNKPAAPVGENAEKINLKVKLDLFALILGQNKNFLRQRAKGKRKRLLSKKNEQP